MVRRPTLQMATDIRFRKSIPPQMQLHPPYCMWGSIGVGLLPPSVAVSADGSTAYVTNGYGYSLSEINTATNAVTSTLLHVGIYRSRPSSHFRGRIRRWFDGLRYKWLRIFAFGNQYRHKCSYIHPTACGDL